MLELEVFGAGVAPCFELLDEDGGAAREEVLEDGDRLSIVVLAGTAGAGGLAEPHLTVGADRGVAGDDGTGAAGEAEVVLELFEDGVEGAGVVEGAVVCSAISVDLAGDAQAGEGIFGAEAEIGVLMIVALGVIACRKKLFNETRLEEEGFELGACFDVIDEGYGRDEAAEAVGLVGAWPEVRLDAAAEVEGFADVDDVALCVAETVDAWALW